MHRKFTRSTPPSIAAIQAETARVEAMIAAAQNLESSDGNIRKFMHLQVCRVELQAYLAGLLYALGETDLFDPDRLAVEMGNPDIRVGNSIVPVCDDEDIRFIECFEC